MCNPIGWLVQRIINNDFMHFCWLALHFVCTMKSKPSQIFTMVCHRHAMELAMTHITRSRQDITRIQFLLGTVKKLFHVVTFSGQLHHATFTGFNRFFYACVF